MDSSHARPASLTASVNRALSRLSRIFETSPPAAHGSRSQPSIDNPFPGRPRVMLADDEPVNHFAIEALLWLRGIRPIHAADGAEAVALACDNHFDLILMDIQMPILDGLNAAAHIRRHERAHGHPSAPIVAYTSSALAHAPEKLRAFGIDGSLAKPCTAVSLEHCLARWCTDGSRPMRAARGLAGSG